MNPFLARLMLVFLSVFSSGLSYAEQAGVVAHEGAKVYQKPNENSSVLMVLRKGTTVSAASKPTQEFYKVRVVSTIGWVKERDLSFKAQTTPTTPSVLYRPYFIKGFGGLQTFSVSALNQRIGTNGLNGIGNDFGIVFGKRISNRFSLMARFERISRTASGSGTFSSATVSPQSANLNLSVSSVPVELGLAFTAMRSKSFALFYELYAGLGFSSGYQASASNSTGSIIASDQLSAMSFAAYLSAEGDFTLSPFWALSSELGYRYLNVSSNGIFGSDSFSTNLGGLVFNLGIKLRF